MVYAKNGGWTVRTMLVSILLMIVVIAIYTSTIGGEDGMKQQLRDSTGNISDSISRIDP